ncbi:MAG TPA: hypothetical protein VM010_03545 [Chitinophagaceae bacterium]|nr:hypothetical protein [Chitinophagaceae bacterium]
MKLFFLCFILTFSNAHITAQDRWTITNRKKEVFAATIEDTTANRVTLTPEDLKNCGVLKIQYTEMPERAGWQRSLLLYDSNGNERKKITATRLKLRHRTLRQLGKNTRQLFLYTTSLPADPAVAATVRVRRVHLCTLILPH